jgi:hypothetical protein
MLEEEQQGANQAFIFLQGFDRQLAKNVTRIEQHQKVVRNSLKEQQEERIRATIEMNGERTEEN